MPVAGVGFFLAFVFAVFAWLMQLSTFWLPVLTGDVRYGHGVCIKLATTNSHESMSSHTHQKSPNHVDHKSHENHDMHAQHMMHDMSAHSEHSSAHHAESHTSHHNHHEHHMISASAHDNARTLMGTIQDSTQDDADNSKSNHCDICMLLASVSSLDVFDDFRFNVIREAQGIATNWLYRQLLETTFDYILPPSRAPPVFS